MLGIVLDEITYLYGNESWGDLLTNYDGKYIVYDAIGNPLADGTWSYTWEQGRKLTKMQGSAGTWNYTYNSDGMRISRSNGSNSYTYWYDSDGKLLRMKYNDVVMSFSYGASGQPMSSTEGNTRCYGCGIHPRLQNTAAGIGCDEVILCSNAESVRMQWRKSTVGKRHRN